MTYIRRLILALALSAGLAPAFAQVPPPVPALPDTERRTSYSISASTCACNVNFALYGDSTDYANWIEVFVNGVRMTQAGNWTLSSVTGTIGSIPLPITNAVLTFTAPQTGTIQIVGARRPRRASQFNEGAGVPTRNFNVVLSDLTAQNRELWDKTNDVTGRALLSQPGNTVGLLPLPSACQGKFLGFDATGLIPTCNAGGPGSGNVVGPGSSVNGNVAIFSGTSGALLADSGTKPVSALTCSTSNWFNTLSAAGALGCSQPNFTDLLGQATLAQLPTLGANTALGSIAGGTPIALSKTQITTLVNPATASLPGTLPAFPNNTTTFFRGDGTYAAPRQATIQKFTTGTGATYTTPATSTYAIIKFCGPGGGGSGSGTGTTGGTGGTGTSSVFNGITCTGGTGATASVAGVGGTCSGGSPTETWAGAPGGGVQSGVASNFLNGGMGGGSVLFGGGSQVAGVAATGGGGGGGFFNGAGNTGGGGGGGGCATQIVAGAGATYTYTVGTAGAGGTIGTGGASAQAGFAGSTGYLQATEY